MFASLGAILTIISIVGAVFSVAVFKRDLVKTTILALIALIIITIFAPAHIWENDFKTIFAPTQYEVTKLVDSIYADLQ